MRALGARGLCSPAPATPKLKACVSRQHEGCVEGRLGSTLAFQPILQQLREVVFEIGRPSRHRLAGCLERGREPAVESALSATANLWGYMMTPEAKQGRESRQIITESR
jgi:hypothetical protein